MKVVNRSFSCGGVAGAGLDATSGVLGDLHVTMDQSKQSAALCIPCDIKSYLQYHALPDRLFLCGCVRLRVYLSYVSMLSALDNAQRADAESAQPLLLSSASALELVARVGRKNKCCAGAIARMWLV